MFRVTHSIEIPQSPAQVFAYVTTAPRWPEWNLRMLVVRQTPAGPLHLGTRIAYERVLLGRRLKGHYLVTTYEQDHAVVYAYASQSLDAERTFAIEPVGSGARFTETVVMTPRGLIRLIEGRLAALTQNQLVSNHAALKARLDSGSLHQNAMVQCSPSTTPELVRAHQP